MDYPYPAPSLVVVVTAVLVLSCGQTRRQTRMMNALLPRLSSAWVIRKHSINTNLRLVHGREKLPESRVVGVGGGACVDRRVIVQCAMFIAEILPLEWRDVSSVLFHFGQQAVADARHWLWRHWLSAVVAHYFVVRLYSTTQSIRLDTCMGMETNGIPRVPWYLGLRSLHCKGKGR